MKKLIAITVGIGFVLATSFAAMADVAVYGTIDKDKDKTVIENVTIDKYVEVGVKQIVKASNSVEAQALKNDINQNNTITEEATDPVAPTYAETNSITSERIELDPGAPSMVNVKKATIDTGSFNDAAGIINANQSPGSMNNQGNATSVAYSGPAVDVERLDYEAEGEARFLGGAFVHAEASVEKINGGWTLGEDGEMPTAAGNNVTAEKSQRDDLIDAAFTGVEGVIGINQSAGSINNQNNAVALSVGEKSVAALSEADLGLVNANNISTELAVALNDTLSNGAFSDASGIIGVNQSSGSMNNQANVVSVCAVSFPDMATVTVP